MNEAWKLQAPATLPASAEGFGPAAGPKSRPRETSAAKGRNGILMRSLRLRRSEFQGGESQTPAGKGRSATPPPQLTSTSTPADGLQAGGGPARQVRKPPCTVGLFPLWFPPQ